MQQAVCLCLSLAACTCPHAHTIHAAREPLTRVLAPGAFTTIFNLVHPTCAVRLISPECSSCPPLILEEMLEVFLNLLSPVKRDESNRKGPRKSTSTDDEFGFCEYEGKTERELMAGVQQEAIGDEAVFEALLRFVLQVHACSWTCEAVARALLQVHTHSDVSMILLADPVAGSTGRAQDKVRAGAQGDAASCSRNLCLCPHAKIALVGDGSGRSSVGRRCERRSRLRV